VVKSNSRFNGVVWTQTFLVLTLSEKWLLEHTSNAMSFEISMEHKISIKFGKECQVKGCKLGN
jgi:hypothetical protein